MICDLNGQQVKLLKCRGPFVWQRFAREDKLFHVVKGNLTIWFRDGETTLRDGKMIVIPKGAEQRPFSEDVVWLMIVEFAGSRTLIAGE